MTDFSIFTDAQLEAAVSRLQAEFTEYADGGYLASASARREQLEAVRFELARRREAADWREQAEAYVDWCRDRGLSVDGELQSRICEAQSLQPL